MKKLIVIWLLIALTACSAGPKTQTETPDIQATIDAGIAQTQKAEINRQPTETLEPTKIETPESTATPNIIYVTLAPTSTPEAAPQDQFLDIIKEALIINKDIEKISAVTGDNGTLKIEVFNRWVSKDSQPIVSYDIITVLADVFVNSSKTENDLAYYCGNGSEPFRIDITTYAKDGDYRYKSLTDYQTIMKIGNKALTYEEWINLSNAGFK